HTLLALGLAGSAGLVGGSVLARLAARIWTAKVLLAISATSLCVVASIAYLAFPKEVKPSKPAMVPPPIMAMAAAPQPAHEPVAETLSAASVEMPAPLPTPVSDRPIARVSATRTSSALRAELAALDAVRSTLANDDSVGALSFLAAYFRTYPRGRLLPEAEVLRIDALAKGGRSQAARQYALEFLRRHPTSLLAPRVRPYANP
ncbi:MAG TPA: hypothetical protein VIM14_17510, partial [Polyangia bacterium]